MFQTIIICSLIQIFRHFSPDFPKQNIKSQTINNQYYNLSNKILLFKWMLYGSYNNNCSLSFFMDQDKNALRRKGMKNFMELRRNQIKNTNEGQVIVSKLNKLILNNDSNSLSEELQLHKPEFIYNYLISQDDLLKTPISFMLQQPKWYDLLKSVNAWSINNTKIIKQNFEKAQATLKEMSKQDQKKSNCNQIHTFLKNRFAQIIRCISTYNHLEEDKLVELFSQKNTLLCQFMTLFLNRLNLKSLVPFNKQLRLYENVFTKIALNLDIESRHEMDLYLGQKKKQKTWDDKQFIEMLSNPSLLSLQQVKYSFMHELALRKDMKYIYEIIEKMQSTQQTPENQAINNIKQRFFCQFDGGGQTPVDIILSKWANQQIRQFLNKIEDVQCVHLSINSLNKVICNKKLTQEQVEGIIQFILAGPIAQRGYSERITRQIKVKQKILEVWGTEYFIVMDKRRVLMAKDKRHSYPLLNYLDRFKQKCLIKIMAQLFFQSLDRQVVKSKVVSLLKQLGKQCKKLEVGVGNQALKQISEIAYYHQSLLIYVCRINNNQIIQFFINKLFINYFEIIVWGENSTSDRVVHLLNRHFLTIYIELNQDLSDTPLNRSILEKIFGAKDSQKFVNDFNLYVELVRQFYLYSNLQKRSEWFVEEVKTNLKKYINNLETEKLVEMKTFINEGKTQKQLSLLKLMPSIYSKEELAAMKLPQESQEPKVDTKSPKKQKYSKKIFKESPKKTQNNYKINKDYSSFQTQLKKVIEEADHRQTKINAKQQEQVKQKQQHQKKNTLYGKWQLDFDETDLESKIKDLIDAGFIIRFNLNKLSVRSSENLYQKYISQLKQPYKAICMSMILNTKKRQKSTVENAGKSLQFHQACLLCDDQQSKIVYEFLKQSPLKFRDVAENWQFFQSQKIQPNIYLLLQIIQTETLRDIYKINLQQNKNILIQIFKQAVKSITADLKSRKQLVKSYIKKMIALKRIKSALLKQNWKIKKQQNEQIMGEVAYYKINNKNNGSKNLSDNNKFQQVEYITDMCHYFLDREKEEKRIPNQFSDFMRLHSEKINLKEFYDTISIQELYRQYGTQQFVIAFQLAQKPIDFLKEVQRIKAKDELDIINRLKKLGADNFIQFQLKGYQKAYNQKFAFLIQDGFYYHHSSEKMVTKFCSVLEKLSQSDFEEYLKISNAKNFQFYKKLLLHIKNENRCLRILDQLILINNRIGEQLQKQLTASEKIQDTSKNISFNGKINRLIKIRKDKLNAALCAFISVDQQVKICPQNPSAGKISLDYSCFIQNLTKNNFEIYVHYICKMLMVKGNYSRGQKYGIVFDIVSKLFGAQEWQKCIILIGTISKTEELDEWKKQLLKGYFDICSRNMPRVASYNQKQEYEQLINNLMSILAATNNHPTDQSLFKYVWDLSPEKAITILKPQALSLQTIARCLQTHPSKVKLIKNIKLDLTTLPCSYRPKFQGKYIPFSKYDVNQIDEQPYLIDLLIFQQQIHNLWVETKGQAIKNYSNALEQKKKSVFMTKQARKRFKQVYNQDELQKFSYQIFNSNVINSLKDVPKDYVQAYFKGSKQIKGLCNLNKNILRELIDDNFVQKQQLFDIIRTCKIEVIDYFLKKSGNTFNYELICEIQQHEQTKLPKRKTSFIQSLIRFENRRFVEQFINHYKIFEVYPSQKYFEMTKQVLWQIPLLQATSILKLFLQHLRSKTKEQQIKFRIPAQQKQAAQQRKTQVAEIQQNKKFYQNHQSEKIKLHQNFSLAKESSTSGVRDGIVFLPLRVAALNGFYEYYFLLLQQSEYNSQLSVLYENSNRFHFECNPQQFSFIPLMKKKLELFKLAQNHFHYKAKNKQFLHSLLRACFFGEVHKTQRCCEFLAYIFKDILTLEQMQFKSEQRKRPNSYISILCLKSLPNLAIPDEDLIKRYPEQAKFIIYLLKNYAVKVTGLELIHQVLKDQQPLRQLLYIADPKYMMKCKQILEDAHLFSYPFALHIRFYEQPQNIQFLEKFIVRCFFKRSSSPIQYPTEQQVLVYEVNSSFKLMRDLLLCCLVSRNEGSNKALSFISSLIRKGQNQFILDCIISICNRRRTSLRSPLMQQKIKLEDLDHNPAFWNSFTQLLKNAHKVKQFKNKGKFRVFFLDKYNGLLNFNSFKSVLETCCDGLLDVFACQTYLCNLMYLIGEQSVLHMFVHQELKKQNCQASLLYSSQLKLQIEQSNLKVYTPVQIIEEPSALVRFVRIDSEKIMQRILTNSFIENLHLEYQSLKQIQCLSKLQFKFDVQSFKNARSLNLLRRMISKDRNEGSGINKIIQIINNLKSQVQQQKNNGVYSLSDVHGPILINDQTDKQKVVECINFYELCLLPDSTITIKYADAPNIKNGYSKAFSDIKEYIRFFTYQINDDQFENKVPYQFNSTISLSPSRKDPEAEQVLLDKFYLHNVITFFDKVDRFSGEISGTFNNEIVVKYSISSIVRLLELYSKNYETAKDLFYFVSSFLGNKRNVRFIETILIMIMEDANNIMKVVKGILILYNYQQNPKVKADRNCYKVDDKISVFDVGYKIQDQIFTITMLVGPSEEKSQLVDSLECSLISRKDFLNTVFSSTEFLTGYFINKSVLANQLVKISKQISQLINSQVNFSINYKQLYSFIDKIKDSMAIKDIDGLLTNLNAFIMFNLKKFILNNLDSRQLALQHQLALLDCFQELNSRDRNIKRDHQWYKINTKSPNENGINYIWNFSTQLKQNDKKGQNIKNVYLIQIYRSYLASIVSEGMCFILGFKSHQPSMLIKIQKKQDFDKINVTELSFILLVSNQLPTSDEINQDKVIKIFVTDLNQNAYQLDSNITQQLLQLSSESQDRNLAHMVPVLPENIILGFNHQFAEKSVLRDDKTSKHIQLNLTEQGKFRLQNKNKFLVSCIDLIKIDTAFNNSVSNLTKSINYFISSNIIILIKAPSRFESKKAIEALEFSFIDFEKCLNNIFTESIRNKELQLYASAQKGEQVRQNLISKLKSKLFVQCLETVSFEIHEQGISKILIQNKTIKIKLAPKQLESLNSTIMSDTICKYLMNVVMANDEKLRQTYYLEDNSECLVPKLQHLLMAKYQMEVIEKCLAISKKIQMDHRPIKKYRIEMKNEQKSRIKYENQQITFTIRLNKPEHQFYSDRKILQYLVNNCEQTTDGISSTRYRPDRADTSQKQQKGEVRIGQLQLNDYDLSNYIKAILIPKDDKPMHEKDIVQADIDKLKSMELAKFYCYYLISKYNQKFCIDSNYIWKTDPSATYASEKKMSGVTHQQYSLILSLPKTLPHTIINMSECNINVVCHAGKNKQDKQISQVVNITRKSLQFEAKIKLLSKETMLLQFTPLVSGQLVVNFQRYDLLHNQELDKMSFISNSCKEMVEENTKFVQLIFRKNSIKPSSRQFEKKEINVIFNEPAERIEQNKMKDNNKSEKSIESMVYIVNEKAVKFLTRAGEERIDVINACDEEGNVTKLKPGSKVWFRHLNILSEILVPAIKQNEERYQLYWTPKIRGPYEAFVNNTRLNPSYEIGVCSASAEISQSKVQLPKKTEICFGEQTELSIELKDSFGNIYTEFEETKKDDHLIIELISDNIPKAAIKIKSDKIDKYGLKKIRFSIDDPTCNQEKNTVMTLSVNMIKLTEFKLKIKGQSLIQRRKNLQKQIQSSTKRYYFDINVSRKNFMECLFKYAQQGLDKNFSVKFAGEQGIDAGGLKREFYDMIGKQLKDPHNPFFIQTDMSRHNEYFINPEIMKNKKKEEYFELFGKYLANSFINGYMIGVNFSTTFVKLLYEDPITFDDMLTVLPKQQARMYESLIDADADYIDDLEIYFSYVFNRKKGIQIEMVQNGKDIKVTKANLKQYLQLLPEFLIVQRYADIVKSFRQGFNKVLKLETVRRWIRSDQFWCMTAGVKQITPEIVLANINIQGGKETHHAWIRAYITEASKEILQGFLKFSSGSSSIDFYQTSKITVKFENQGENPKKLPISHTCWKQIDIPAYKTYAIMKQLLNAAFLYCSEGFGFG